MDVRTVFTGMPVTSLQGGREFYTRLFGRPADVEVAADEVMWQVAETAWLYVVVDAARAGHGLVALSVPDLDATLAGLEQRGLRPHHMEEAGGGRKAVLLDPGGNTVAVISVPASPRDVPAGGAALRGAAAFKLPGVADDG